MKSLYPTLDPHPTARSYLFIRSRNYAFVTKQSEVSLLCHWVEAKLSKYNHWYELFFRDNKFHHSILKHPITFKINLYFFHI